MARYKAGDRAAFRELFDRYAPRLRRTMLRGLFAREVADDLVQQTFLQVHRARNDYREGAAFRPWVYTIALNLKRSHFRKVARRPETAMPMEPETVDGDPDELMAARELRAVVSELPDGQRQIVELFWFEGFSFPEIAQVIGSTHGAVKVRAHRAYKVIRKLLEDRGVTDPGQLAYLGRPSA